MGLRGPAETPRSVLAARGSPKANDRPDDLELPAAQIDPPEGMGAEASKQWKHVVGLLQPRGALSEGDRMALTLMCEMWAEDRVLSAEVAKETPGSMDWKRLVNARGEVRKQLVVMLTKFGLTPVDRPRVKVNTPEKQKPADGKFKPKLVG